MKCPICKNTKSSKEFVVARDERDKYSYFKETEEYSPAKYWECSNCEAMIWDENSDYERIYESFAYTIETGDSVEFIRKRFETILKLPPEKSDNVQRVKRIRSFLAQYTNNDFKKIQTILDIGAGLGIFLHSFLNNNWEGTAIEPDKNACKHMRSFLPETKIYQGYINDLNLFEKYDLITINRMLEHVSNPYLILKKVTSILKNSGYLYIELPDVRSYFYNGPHDQDFGYGHYIIYSPITMSIMASYSGLELMSLQRVIEPSKKYTIYGFFKLSKKFKRYIV